MTERECRACGEPVEGDRRRRYCDDRCKMRFHRGARAPKKAEPVEPANAVVACAAATIEALAAVGKLGDPVGQSALKLAHRIDNSDRDTASGVASLTKQHRELMDALLADVPGESDAVDELKAKRDAKRAAAAG